MPDHVDVRRFADRARSELPEERFEAVRQLSQRALQSLADGNVPRDGLVRSSDDGELTGSDDGRTIEGYGGVTNQVTRINSWEGDFEEEFLTGSFKRTARNQIPKMQFDHGQSMLLGSVPMGRWDAAEEDEHGLHLGPGRVFDNLWTSPIRDAIAGGEIGGMSIRFSVVREEWVDRDGKEIKDDRELFDLIFWGVGLDERGPIRRRVKEAKVPEAGPVVWPAYAGTSVGLRNNSVTIDLARLHDPAQQKLLARAVYLADAHQIASPAHVVDGDPEQRAEQQDDADTGVEHDSNTDRDSRLTERSTDTEHAAPAPPPVTDPSPGEHSPAGRPNNPTERRALMRQEFRERTDRLLAIPDMDRDKENRS